MRDPKTGVDHVVNAAGMKQGVVVRGQKIRRVLHQAVVRKGHAEKYDHGNSKRFVRDLHVIVQLGGSALFPWKIRVRNTSGRKILKVLVLSSRRRKNLYAFRKARA